MGDRSGIEWTDATWNPVLGCSPVSEGCRNCYAAKESIRLAGHPNAKVRDAYAGLSEMRGQGKDRRAVFTGVMRLMEDRLDQPLRWKRPRRIFVNSMSDLFHAGVPDAFIDRVFQVMADAPQHIFQVLTKRPQRMRAYVAAAGGTNPLPNVWLGISVEDQAAADERIPHLVETPAAVRFLSCEPLLGPVDLDPNWLHPKNPDPMPLDGRFRLPEEGVGWVIVGGESGPGARPMMAGWAWALRDQCEAWDVPFTFKQWGAWAPLTGTGAKPPTPAGVWTSDPGRLMDHLDSVMCRVGDYGFITGLIAGGEPASQHMARVGKKAAGRVLDGVVHDAQPGPAVLP